MTRITRRLKPLVKSVGERALGVSISRAHRLSPNEQAGEAIRRMRRWSAADVVIDAGANDGRTVLRIQELLSRPRILAFEPVASTYRVLVERTSHLRNVRTFPFALGACCGRQTIYLDAVASMNSFSQQWIATPAGAETVEVTTVDHVMVDQEIEFVHLLKIDTEGHEMQVLQGAERALRANRIAAILLEVGFDQVDKPFLTLEAARQYLASSGYGLQGVYNQCRRRAQPPAAWTLEQAEGFTPELLAYCDALFIGAAL